MKKNGIPLAGSGKAFAAVPSFFLFFISFHYGRNKMDTSALFKISYGLFVLTAKGKDGRKSGCIINTAMQVTSNPVRICFTVNKANFTHDLVLESGRFTLSVLSEKASVVPTACRISRPARTPGFPAKWCSTSMWGPTACLWLT